MFCFSGYGVCVILARLTKDVCGSSTPRALEAEVPATKLRGEVP